MKRLFPPICANRVLTCTPYAYEVFSKKTGDGGERGGEEWRAQENTAELSNGPLLRFSLEKHTPTLRGICACFFTLAPFLFVFRVLEVNCAHSGIQNAAGFLKSL